MRGNSGVAFVTLSVLLLAVSPATGEQTEPIEQIAPTTVSAPGPTAAVGSPARRLPVLRLDFDGGPEAAGDPLHRLNSSGRAPVRAVVVRRGAGAATRVPGRRGAWAARLPAYRAHPDPPRASIRLDAAGPTDRFSPGASDFRFGADFRLDAVSHGSRLDNGDNLVQRGLFGQPAQYKVQVDGRVPLCRIKGRDGAATARTRSVRSQQWYRVRCLRRGPAVTIRVWRLTPRGPVGFDSATARSGTGPVVFARRLPLSVGGKLDDSGEVALGSSDQFNGVVDEVVYDTAD